MLEKFELYGALWLFCSEYHSGMSSRGYRILSKLSRAGYNPGMGLQRNCLETEEQAEIYLTLVERYADKV